jgi:opacity protein-like surface antigen
VPTSDEVGLRIQRRPDPPEGEHQQNKEKSSMVRKTILMAMAMAVAAATVSAQEPRVELSATAGWTFSDGVSGAGVTVPGVGVFDRIDPKDAFSWGARLGFNMTPNVEVGFLFNQQSTTLEVGGTSSFDLGDLKVYNYHGYVAYNFGDSDASVRPYFLGGIGATQFGSIAVNAGGVERDIDGTTKFSTTWGAGLKLFPSPNFGIRLEGRWVPTYIKSDAVGWWCDPYWGCYVVGDAQYSNQFELAGGITLRF